MQTETGMLVGLPLLRGGSHCMFHAQIFNAGPAEMRDPMIFYLDFETDGLDVLGNSIVEIGLLQGAGSSVYSTVVRPPASAARESSEPAVHGISDEELAQGPGFREAFVRMVGFLDNLVDMAVNDESESSCDELSEGPTLRGAPPQVLIAAHNGIKFDIPILFAECLRHDLGLDVFDKWLFVDTLHVLRALDTSSTGGCVKLQCLLRHLKAADGLLQAHRALDDCFALRGVVQFLAEVHGVSALSLLAPFVVAMDMDATLAQLSCML